MSELGVRDEADSWQRLSSAFLGFAAELAEEAPRHWQGLGLKRRGEKIAVAVLGSPQVPRVGLLRELFRKADFEADRRVLHLAGSELEVVGAPRLEVRVLRAAFSTSPTQQAPPLPPVPPVPCGSHISYRGGAAGTLGFLGIDADGFVHAVSAAHAIAPPGTPPRTDSFADILCVNGPVAQEVFAIPESEGDAARCLLDDPTMVQSNIPIRDLGITLAPDRCLNTRLPRPGTPVYKVGISTGFTCGITDMVIGSFGNGNILVTPSFLISPLDMIPPRTHITDLGDSGALWCRLSDYPQYYPTGEAVGLNIAQETSGGVVKALAVPADYVLQQLGLVGFAP